MRSQDKVQRKIRSLIPRFVPVCLLVAVSIANAQPASPWKGRELFQKNGCVTCHSVFGEGGKGGPDLGKIKFYGTYLELASLLWQHFPKMSKMMQKTGYAYPEFTTEEMQQLITYLSYIRYLGEPGNVARGKRLLRSKGCINCHKFGGKGGTVGPDFSTIPDYLSPLRLVESMWNHGPKIMEKMERFRYKRPEFRGKEIIDLAAGIRSYMSPKRVDTKAFALGDPKKGKILIEMKGCTRCHAIRGVGGDIGPDYAEIDLNYSVTQIAGKMWNHGPKMWKTMEEKGIPVPTFARGEMADVIAYLYSIKLEDAPGDEARGKEIITSKNCLNCHALKGEGGDVAADLSEITLESPLAMIAAMWNHAPAMQEKLREKKLQWPTLSGRDMADIYAYLQALTQDASRKEMR